MPTPVGVSLSIHRMGRWCALSVTMANTLTARNYENTILVGLFLPDFGLCCLSPHGCDVMLCLGIPLKPLKTPYTGFLGVR